MSYIQQEKSFEQAVLFLSEAVSQLEQIPTATLLHSIRVGLWLHQNGYSPEIVLGGFLHDIVEDTAITIEEVQAQFGERVAELVEAMTYDQNLPSDTRSQDSMDRCKALGKDALAIKAADLLDNLNAYLPEANPARFGQLADSLKYFLATSENELGETTAWKEISHTLEKVLSLMESQAPGS